MSDLHSAPDVPPEDQVIPPLRPMPEDAEYLTFTGKCFCGKYSFTVQHPSLEIRRPIVCNCSYCSITNMMAIYANDTQFKLTTHAKDGDDAKMGAWAHPRYPMSHYFCEKCGSNVFWQGFGKVGVNARCMDGFDPATQKTTFFDGKRFA